MTKKYNLILGCNSNGYTVVYVKTKHGDVGIDVLFPGDQLSTNNYQFTQDEIDKLKNSLPTEQMREKVDLAKVEVKEPLYYMQSKRTNPDGYRLFFTLLKDDWRLEDINSFPDDSFEDFSEHANNKTRVHSLLSKEEWQPYLTPDRELVKYEPKEGK